VLHHLTPRTEQVRQEQWYDLHASFHCRWRHLPSSVELASMTNHRQPPKKGLSYEEKRSKTLEYFHETKDFYQLKELEKLLPKSKGIISQSVKEVIESLIADGTVTSEKIGTSVYYWSFPSKALMVKKTRLAELEHKVVQETKRKKDLQVTLEGLKVGREDSEQRQQVLTQLQVVELEHQALNKELATYRDNDPVLFEAKRKAAEQAKEAVNRHTDNIFALQSFCMNKFGMSNTDFSNAFEVPDLDNI